MSSSLFRCGCGSVNRFNPAMGWTVRCGVCNQIVALQPPRLLVTCPNRQCMLKMTMAANVNVARCPRCSMMFTTRRPQQQPPPMQQRYPSSPPQQHGGYQQYQSPPQHYQQQPPVQQGPVMGSVVTPPSSPQQQPQGYPPARSPQQQTQKFSAPMPDHVSPNAQTAGGTYSNQPQVDTAPSAPDHFSSGDPLPMAAAVEEELEWTIANQQFDNTFGTRRQ